MKKYLRKINFHRKYSPVGEQANIDLAISAIQNRGGNIHRLSQKDRGRDWGVPWSGKSK